MIKLSDKSERGCSGDPRWLDESMFRFSSHWSANATFQTDDPETGCPRLWCHLAAEQDTSDDWRVAVRACVTRVPHVVSFDVVEALDKCHEYNHTIFLSEHIHLPLTAFWYEKVFHWYLLRLCTFSLFAFCFSVCELWELYLVQPIGVMIALWIWVACNLVLIEWGQYTRMGWDRYWRDWGNRLDLFGSFAVWLAALLRAVGHNVASEVAAMAVLALGLRGFLYLQIFECTNSFFFFPAQVAQEARGFAFISSVLLSVFTVLFYVLNSYDKFLDSLQYTFRMMLGDFEGLDLHVDDDGDGFDSDGAAVDRLTTFVYFGFILILVSIYPIFLLNLM